MLIADQELLFDWLKLLLKVWPSPKLVVNLLDSLKCSNSYKLLESGHHGVAMRCTVEMCNRIAINEVCHRCLLHPQIQIVCQPDLLLSQRI